MQIYIFEVLVQGSWNGNAIAYRDRQHALDSAADLQSRWTLVRDWRIIEINEEIAEKRKLTILDKPIIKGAGHSVQL